MVLELRHIKSQAGRVSECGAHYILSGAGGAIPTADRGAPVAGRRSICCTRSRTATEWVGTRTVMSPRPPASPPGRVRAGTEQAEALADRESAPALLWTADGIPLVTRCWASKGALRGAVVLVHGLAGNKDDPRVALLAEELHARAFDVIAYDARGHGRSGGVCTLGHQERHDVASAVSWARSRSPKVVVVGASLGAVAALSYAATDRDLSGVVAVSSPADWRLPLRPRSLLTAGMARTRVGRGFADRRMQVRIARWSDPEPPRSLVERVTCPLVAVHGRRDPIIPLSMGLGTIVAGDPLRSAVVVGNMGHAFDPVAVGPICAAAEWVIEIADRKREPRGGLRPPVGSAATTDG